MPVFLGIDAGTTNVKAILADENDNILAHCSCPAITLSPFAGANEMDMDALWECICKLTRALREKAPAAFGQMEGMGISAQGDGMWPVDKNGAPVRNAILWNDARTRELEGIDAEALDALLIANASTALFAGASPLILKWMSVNEPDLFGKIHRVLRCKDWLNFKLTGCMVSDYTDYSTCGINIFTKRHVPEIYDFLGIPKAWQMLPELAASTDIIGKVTAEASARSGIPQGTPVIGGAIDVVATALGAGVTKPGDGCAILGTTLCSDILIEAAQVNVSDRNGSTLCSIIPGEYIRLMAALSGTSAIDWAKSVLAPDISFTELEKQLEEIPAGSCGVLYHPYINGERAPFRNPFACSGFYNLNARHTRLEMMRAVYEGMALSLKDCHTALPNADGSIYLAGGGAVSDFTCGLIAHVLGRRVVRQNRKELAARGIVEAVKLGLGVASGCAREESFDAFEPNPELFRMYEQIYARLVETRVSMDPLWSKREKA